MENIKSCKCKHAFQDEVYGVGMRVHTQHSKGHRCTVCGADKLTNTKK